ncbi:MAG: hypothetical protein H6Q76_1027 [Firmicutes bacterium]|nr:hypothetical protein [Bacillota bacterium]
MTYTTLRLETATSWAKYIIYAVLLALLAAGCWYGWQRLHPASVPVIATTQQAAQITVGVQTAAQTAHVPLSHSQASEIAHQIADSVDDTPAATVQTTGSAWEGMAAKIGTATKSDMVIVTDPKNPTQKPNPLPTDTVQQNVYAIHAYPDHLWTAGVSSNKDYSIGYSKRAKVFGKVAYVMPEIELRNGNNVVFWLKLQIPEQAESKKKIAAQVQTIK